MWEIERCDWEEMRSFRDSGKVRDALSSLHAVVDGDEWQKALNWIEPYASNLGVPSEATSSVVAVLVRIVVSSSGKKRSAVLSCIEELTCGRGLDQYSAQHVDWLANSVRELSYALHTWVCIAESGELADAVLAITLLVYCSVYVPNTEARVSRYLGLCRRNRPELEDDIAALLQNANEVRGLLGSVRVG